MDADGIEGVKPQSNISNDLAVIGYLVDPCRNETCFDESPLEGAISGAGVFFASSPAAPVKFRQRDENVDLARLNTKILRHIKALKESSDNFQVLIM